VNYVEDEKEAIPKGSAFCPLRRSEVQRHESVNGAIHLQSNKGECLDNVSRTACGMGKVFGCKHKGNEPEEGEKDVESQMGHRVRAQSKRGEKEDGGKDSLGEIYYQLLYVFKAKKKKRKEKNTKKPSKNRRRVF
jgi:hypothetical protein